MGYSPFSFNKIITNKSTSALIAAYKAKLGLRYRNNFF
ncbi:MAG: hypothetical protein OJF59_002056 [Cytophagales bacterium]|nr:MAG: hypothetical protein OJF59_002056 [Cytophagales bacterium]